MIGILACHTAPPDAGEVFPYVYTPETDLEPYEEVRWETETWEPFVDTDMAALYLMKASLHRPGAPEESLEHFDTMRTRIPPLGAGTRISFVGDVMWVGDNWAGFATPAAELLDGDLRAGNLETPTSPDHPQEPGELGLYTFNAPPELLDGLPLDVLQLNNNHTMDVGDEGIEATLAEVDARGFARTGVDGHGQVGDVAFLSYTWGLNDRDVVSTHELFVVPFGHLDEDIDLAGLEEDIAAARGAGAASVVVMVHWGYEYEYYPDPHFLVLGRRIVAAGADVVVGSGPHVVQPPEICAVNDPDAESGIGICAVTTADGEPRTAAILYSLGNFGTVMQTWPCKVGIVATVSLDPDVTGLGWEGAAMGYGDDGIEIQPLDAAVDDPEVADEEARLAAHLGEGWRR